MTSAHCGAAFAAQDLKDSVKKLLKLFYERSKHKPERIIFMRDGVSEGQFPQVWTSCVLSYCAMGTWSIFSKHCLRYLCGGYSELFFPSPY